MRILSFLAKFSIKLGCGCSSVVEKSTTEPEIEGLNPGTRKKVCFFEK
jgi:hypothetical protein